MSRAVRLTNATLLVLTTASCCCVINDREAIPWSMALTLVSYTLHRLKKQLPLEIPKGGSVFKSLFRFLYMIFHVGRAATQRCGSTLYRLFGIFIKRGSRKSADPGHLPLTEERSLLNSFSSRGKREERFLLNLELSTACRVFSRKTG